MDTQPDTLLNQAQVSLNKLSAHLCRECYSVKHSPLPQGDLSGVGCPARRREVDSPVEAGVCVCACTCVCVCVCVCTERSSRGACRPWEDCGQWGWRSGGWWQGTRALLRAGKEGRGWGESRRHLLLTPLTHLDTQSSDNRIRIQLFKAPILWSNQSSCQAPWLHDD
uniref:Uncharacterized protein n=1 Tax=Pipistrellus kuhlii TaxID=59472 RepID=A0A7J8B209_PIPKU|nr:hypothetical protein mPipKuh1_007722 [Pipistrellus kuhlii]